MPQTRPFVRTSLALLALFAAAACDDSRGVQARPPFLAPSADALDFGEVDVGQSKQRTVFFINKGEMTLTIRSVGGDLLDGVFSVIEAGGTVAPSGDFAVHVVFTPAEAKDYQTTLVFSNDSANQPEFNLVLRGKGLPTDPCRGVVCNDPPAQRCIGATKSRGWNPLGKCIEGQCVYDPIDEDCPQYGCNPDSGFCQLDPCLGKSCQTPPNGCFLTNGVCQDGACTYTVNNDALCNDGDPCTLDDKCTDGQCRGTRRTCPDTPQPPACWDAKTLRHFEAAGTCESDGQCHYAHRDVLCEFGCDNGACKGDPCAGGCDDGNPCTADRCVHAVGCEHTADDTATCTTTSGDCPQGRCIAGRCQPTADVTCVAEYEVDLCQDAEIAGVCTAAGECVVREVPPEYTCPGCNGICLKCYFIQICIPL